MAGLNVGLLDGFGDTKKLVAGRGPQIAAAVQAPAVTIPGRPGLARGGDGASAGTDAAPGATLQQHFHGLQETGPRRLAKFSALAAEQAGIG